MYKIMRIEEEAGIYPDNQFLEDYEGYDAASLISTLGVEAMIGNDRVRIGDSGVYVKIIYTGNTGDVGLNEFAEYAKEMISLIKEAIPAMSKTYADFYGHFVRDFEENGLTMPFKGKIL